LSYTSFAYAWAKQPVVVKDSISFSVKIKNTGNYDGDEVVQVYVHYPKQDGMPVKELKTFKRLTVNKDGEGTIVFNIPLLELQKWDEKKQTWKLYSGDYKIIVGENADDEKLNAVIEIK